jgi:hypothetical protein
LPLHFEVKRLTGMKNPAFLLNLSSGSVRAVEDELEKELIMEQTPFDVKTSDLC